MKQYLRERNERARNATAAGITMTLVLHLCALLSVTFSGLKYLYPPPPENVFLLDMVEETEMPVRQRDGQEPRSENVDKEKNITLVQRSASPHESKQANLTLATREDPHGDVDVPAPEQQEEPLLDPRAAFPGMARKDTSLTAPHGASEASALFKAGQPDGNTEKGSPEGKANARLEGRYVDKSGLKKPAYASQESGTVVVKIWVDQYGKVQKAVPGADGTTVTDKALWAAARNAAMETGFNMKANAPALQEGTITYIFNLK
ncbi:MAG: TonB family protein [Bacteroidales bacterium]|nr:TonB family protein [Bacteroidales bacterium]